MGHTHTPQQRREFHAQLHRTGFRGGGQQHQVRAESQMAQFLLVAAGLAVGDHNISTTRCLGGSLHRHHREGKFTTNRIGQGRAIAIGINNADRTVPTRPDGSQMQAGAGFGHAALLAGDGDEHRSPPMESMHYFRHFGQG